MKTKILLVDNEHDIVEFLQYNLEKEGFAVISAYDGIEALEKINQKPDLVIVATPIYTHHILVQEVIDHGINVICEKNMASTINEIERVWKDIYPSYPFEYRFFDEDFANLFRNDRQFSNLITNFTILAILIACLGLFGLAAFTADQKTKEIGMRKILGADVRSIMYLLSKDFAMLVIIASLIASPIAYFTMNGWLEGFVYKIDMSVWVYIFSSLIIVVISITTILFQSWRSSKTSVVNILKIS